MVCFGAVLVKKHRRFSIKLEFELYWLNKNNKKEKENLKLSKSYLSIQTLHFLGKNILNGFTRTGILLSW